MTRPCNPHAAAAAAAVRGMTESDKSDLPQCKQHAKIPLLIWAVE